MFKSILPHEARVSRRIPSKIDHHLQSSAYAPLATALHLGSLRLKAAVQRLVRKHLA